MFHVYIIQSDSCPERFYKGFTGKSVTCRLLEHNTGKSSHTKKYKPWNLVWLAGFTDKQKALNFEKYLKSGSGRAFARKRLF